MQYLAIDDAIDHLIAKVAELEARLRFVEEAPAPPSEWMTVQETTTIVNRSQGTLNSWRMKLSLGLIEGIHWRRKGGIQYHRKAFGHWYANRNKPGVHTDWLIANAKEVKKK